MDPNWSSGSRSGNKDRVQIVKPVSLGKWVDRKTPKDVFTPPSAPYNPKLKKQRYTPTDIYKYRTVDEVTQTTLGPVYGEDNNPETPLPTTDLGVSPQDVEMLPSPGMPPPLEGSTTDSEGINNLMETIYFAREQPRSNRRNRPFVTLILPNPIEPSGRGSVVVGETQTNVEPSMPGAFPRSHSYNLRPRLIDNDRSAVDRVYVPSRTTNNPAADAVVNNPANPNEPVARYNDHTTLTVVDAENNVLLNDRPVNITTADVLRARRAGIGNLTVNIDERPSIDDATMSSYESTTQDLPTTIGNTNSTAYSLFLTAQNFLQSLSAYDSSESNTPESNTPETNSPPPEMSATGLRSQEVLQAAESTARILAASRNTIDTINSPNLRPAQLRRAVRNNQPSGRFQAPSGLTSSEEEDVSPTVSSLGSMDDLEIATDTVENVVEAIENLADVVEASGEPERARPLRAAAAQAQQRIQENIRLMDNWDAPPRETDSPPPIPTPPPGYEPNPDYVPDYSNLPDRLAPRDNVTTTVEEQYADVQRAVNLLEPNPMAEAIARRRSEILRRNPTLGGQILRRSERLASRTGFPTENVSVNRRPPVTQPQRPSENDRYNLRPRRR
jgi:hypothetical protein